jgi:hypothetical protein
MFEMDGGLMQFGLTKSFRLVVYVPRACRRKLLSKLVSFLLHELDGMTSELGSREFMHPPSCRRMGTGFLNGIYVSGLGKTQNEPTGPDSQVGLSALRKPGGRIHATTSLTHE